jgi:hypothetical protein
LSAQRLFRRHDAASQAKYQDVKQLARAQTRVLSGTPGTLKHRIQNSKRYWVREYIRVDGRKVDDYVGAETSVGEAKIATLRAEMDLAKGLASGSSMLRVLGFQRIERNAAAVLASFFNRGLFHAGLTLVGSHAYGVLLNELGAIAPGYRTLDVDVARAQPLAITLPGGISFMQLLSESGLEFVAVPGMPSHRPSSSFKLPGRESLAVDLLVPGKDAGAVVAVKELATHAQAIPFLDFLVEDAIEGIVLSPNQVIPVSVPSPERFALHKLFSSQSRKANRDKLRKDLEQAAVLAAIVEEETPGRIRDAFRRVPLSGRPAMKRGARAAAGFLRDVHSEAEEVLRRLAGK